MTRCLPGDPATRLSNCTRPLLLSCAVMVLLVGCRAADSPIVVGGSLTLGTWGGDNAGLIATDSVAHVHIGCTFGDVPGIIALDANGRFVVNGSYVLRAYPVYVGPSLPAQFSGQVVGKTLTLAIAVNDTVAKKVVALGPVTVTLGRDPSMGPCPICLVPRRYGAEMPRIMSPRVAAEVTRHQPSHERPAPRNQQ